MVSLDPPCSGSLRVPATSAFLCNLNDKIASFPALLRCPEEREVDRSKLSRRHDDVHEMLAHLGIGGGGVLRVLPLVAAPAQAERGRGLNPQRSSGRHGL